MPVGIAFFLAFGNPEEGATRWCAYRTRAQIETAAAQASELAGESAELGWTGAAVTRLVLTSQSEDALAVDTYSFNRAGQVVKLVRRGNYITDRPATAVFVGAADGSLVQTPETRRTLARLKIESYWLDWPRYNQLERLPFANLITRRNGLLSVRFGCAKPQP